jgi:hypothetical protein
MSGSAALCGSASGSAYMAVRAAVYDSANGSVYAAVRAAVCAWQCEHQ